MKQIVLQICSTLMAVSLLACGAGESPKKEEVTGMKITVGGQMFRAALADNAAACAFADMMQNEDVVVSLSDHGGFEKVGALGVSLPADNSSITAEEGDIILYNGNQIVVFYGANTWSYTRLGKVDDLSGFKEALGTGDVTITFSAD